MPAQSPGEPLPRVVRGSVRTQRRRCGKENCRCAGGEALHEACVLSYWDGNSNRTLMLAPEDVAAVKRAVERYHRAQGRLEQEADAGIAALQRRAAARRPR